MSNNLIICGYPGIGKSSIAGWNHCVDLESSVFSQEVDYTKWVDIYCRTAINLASQGYTVFVSTHQSVVEYLHDAQLELRRVGVHGPFLVYPDKKLKYHWITKLLKRFQMNQNTKNYRAYERAMDHWDKDIAFLDSYAPSHSYAVHDAEKYDLKNIVQEIRNWTESAIVQGKWVDEELQQAKGD